MNCLEFETKFQQFLDDRVTPAVDDAMQTHMQACQSCQKNWQMWIQIDDALSAQAPETGVANQTVSRFSETSTQNPDPVVGLQPHWQGVGRFVAAAAVLIIATLAYTGLDNPFRLVLLDAPPVDSSTLTESAQVTLSTADVDPVLWWNDIRQTDWINRTMPTVRSVREGVAPLGRTLRRAVTLLATAPRTDAILVDPDVSDESSLSQEKTS